MIGKSKPLRIGLIAFDGKIPNLALMKLSTFYKSIGAEVFFDEVPYDVDIAYCSVLFSWNKEKANELRHLYPKIEFGGNGWDKYKKLPVEIEACQPDYSLYTTAYLYQRIKGIMKKETRLQKAETLSRMGLGFTSRGCVRACSFCDVPTKEGKFHHVGEIKDLINPLSNVITLLDNNFTADPLMIEKCQEIKERKLIVDISQGIDIRLLTEEKAKALSQVRHLRSIHYAWDLMEFEKPIIEGINLLSKHIKKYRHMCYMLVGFNTTFEEDMYRFRKLRELKIDPYVMIYNDKGNHQLKCFDRWVNGRIYTKSTWEEYIPWMQSKNQITMAI